MDGKNGCTCSHLLYNKYRLFNNILDRHYQSFSKGSNLLAAFLLGYHEPPKKVIKIQKISFSPWTGIVPNSIHSTKESTSRKS